MDSLFTPDVVSEEHKQARHSPAGGKCYVCMQPHVHFVLLSEFTKGDVSDLNMSYYSLWGDGGG